MLNHVLKSFLEGFIDGAVEQAKKNRVVKEDMEFERFFNDFVGFLESILTPTQARLCADWMKRNRGRYGF